MAEESDRSQFPPGWECRYDIRSGRPYVNSDKNSLYLINEHYNKKILIFGIPFSFHKWLVLRNDYFIEFYSVV